MKTVAATLARMLEYVLSAGLLLLLCLTLWQVFVRYIVGEPNTYTDELLRIVLMWFGMLAGAYCVWSRAHIGFDLITKKLRPALHKMVSATVLAVSVAVATVGLIYGGLRLVLLAGELDQRTAVMGLAMAHVYWVLPISGVLIVIFLLAIGEEPLREDESADAGLNQGERK